jgi:PAS domain S-box-containing protein
MQDPFDLSKGDFFARVMRSDGLLLVADHEQEPRATLPAPLAHAGIVASVGLQIVGLGGSRGLLAAHFRQKRIIDSEAQSFLKGVAGILSIAFRRYEAEESRRHSEQHLALVLDNVVEAVLTIDRAGKILSVNRALCRLFGYKDTDLVGSRVSTLFALASPSEPGVSFTEQVSLDGSGPERVEREMQARHADGSRFTVEFSLGRMPSGPAHIYAGIIRDITQRKAAEQVLSEIQLRHMQLERLAVAGELAGVVVHEVRTPLNALSINAQLLDRVLKKEGDDSRGRARELLRTLRGEIDRINDILSQYLRVLRQPPTMEIRPLSLVEIIKTSVQLLKLKAASCGIQINVDLPDLLPRVLGDHDRLRQVLLNLMLNAIQAMPDGGAIRITATLEQNVVQLQITDSGKGIPEDQLERIFQPFVTSKEGGTGLGLAICERLLEAMNGTISAHSSSGEGATFLVRLPTM